MRRRSSTRSLCAFSFAFLTSIVGSQPAAAQLRAHVVAAGFTSPVAVVPDPLTAGVLFVVQQNGIVRVVQNGVTLPTPFLDLSSSVTAAPRGERGLLGLAFPPNAASRRVFVNFTDRTGSGNTVVARFYRSSTDPLVVNASSQFNLQWRDGRRFIEQPYQNHKGGNLAFGPDGYLYIGLGDGGSGNDPQNRAQDPQTLLGKMLRIDVNVSDTDPEGYDVPPSNPFVGIPAVLPEIWALGYRNPWRYSFDDYGGGATGALIVGDVGQGAREEIDYEPVGRGGRNYGWSIFEGLISTPGIVGRSPISPVTFPIADYPPEMGRAVTGGYVYRGTLLAATYRGRYFLGDFVSGRIFSLRFALDSAGEARVADYVEHTAELGKPSAVASFGRGLDGELYFTSFNGTVYRIAPGGAVPAAPTNLTNIVSGASVMLSWNSGAGGGAASLYRIEVGSQPGASNLLVTQTAATGVASNGVANGIYYVRVRAGNTAGLSDASNEIVVTVGCTGPPVAPTGYASQVAPLFASLSWNPVPNATGYQVEAGSATGLTNMGVFQTTTPSLAGSAPRGTYHTRVRAINACGAGAATPELIVTIP
jgi:glucose/arabinose dehydrogenase